MIVILFLIHLCNYDNLVDQNVKETEDEHVALANLIANLTLDIKENKNILKQLKKANASLTHELSGCKTLLEETKRSLRESISTRDSCLIAYQQKQTELEEYKTFNDRTIDYDKLEHRLNETLGLLAQKENEIQEGGLVDQKDSPRIAASELNAGCQMFLPPRFAVLNIHRGLPDPRRKCLLQGPYKATTVTVATVVATDTSPAVPEHTTVEKVLNMSLENKAHYQSEKEAIFLLFTRIGDEIYSTVDACGSLLEMESQ
ncbi:hypothetical protein Tco_0250840 [Tanacetum coccineum]